MKINGTLNATMTLNFSKLGVSMVIKNEFIGSGDRSGSEIATKIAALGVTPNADYQNKGLKSVAGADWATGSNTLKAIVTSTAGNIRLISTAGVTSVQGYNGAGSDEAITNGSWTDGSATVLAFTGSASQLNNVLKTLEVNNTTGVGEISVDIVRSDISVFTNGGVTSYYEVISPGSIT